MTAIMAVVLSADRPYRDKFFGSVPDEATARTGLPAEVTAMTKFSPPMSGTCCPSIRELQRKLYFLMATRDSGLRRTIAICTHGIRKAAFEVNIKNNNVYINRQNGAAHLSMHSSGQLHFKNGSKYVMWTGGLNGEWIPMRLGKTPPAQVTERQECGTYGWSFSQLLLLPDCNEEPDVVVCSVADLSPDALIAITTSIVCPAQPRRNQILGFPVVWQTRLTSGVTVELEAFLLSEEVAQKKWNPEELSD